ncbi:MAG TPA: S-layer homology domain-containing protein [Acidimicrobiia bacterium]|nr:S-layer homology domain-containing protein [Acidimicrobiia bacterium]
MPKQVLTRRRSLVAKLTVLAVIASLLAVAVPASAAIDTSASCPSTIPSSGFTDIGGYDATTQLAINCLVHYGITQGTSATTFSPTLSVSRWQMALFLTRQAVDHGLTLGDGSSQGFTDIGGFDAATQLAINQLAQLDITQGTSATTFEPNLVVSRWQMALFLTRLADAAGVTLPSGAPQGFLDIATLSVEAQLAINQAHQLGIADGFSATVYSPFTDTLRWQMALFLTRTLAVDGVLPTGLGFTIIPPAPDLVNDVITYDNNGVSATVDYTGGTSFTVDGVASSIGVFEANLSVGDKIAFTGTSFALTNVTVSSGLVNDVKIAGNTFDIVLSTGPTVNNDINYTTAGVVQWTVGGTQVTEITFESHLSNGDTIAITGPATGTVANPRVFGLTNGTATGTITAVDLPAANDFSIKTAAGATLGVNNLAVPAGDALVLTVDGSAVTQANFDLATTNGDTISYSRAAGIVTAALTDAAPAAVTAEAVDDYVLPNFNVVVGTAVVQLQTNDDVPGATAGAAWGEIVVNGISDTEANFIAALSPGDVITYRVADAATSTTSRLTLVDAAYSGTASAYDTVTDTLAVFSSGASGPQLEVVQFAVVDADLKLTLGTGGVLRYTVGGATATQAQFEAAVNFGFANAVGTVSVSKVGVDIVWNATTS